MGNALSSCNHKQTARSAYSTSVAGAVGTRNPISQNKNTATHPRIAHTKGRATTTALIAITAYDKLRIDTYLRIGIPSPELIGSTYAL